MSELPAAKRPKFFELFRQMLMRDFIKDKEVISIRDHFFVRNDQP